jgi:hypothetical protein
VDYVIERTHVIDHERFLEAGPHARDLWEWGMKYSGKFELDGAIPMAAVIASPWGYGGKANIKAAAKLVDVGLWERTDKGFQIRKWSEQGNKTKAEIEAARAKWREKKKPKTPRELPRGNTEGNPSGFLNSTSYSSSFSDQEIKIPEEIPSARAKPDPGAKPPDWWASVLETMAMQTGETIPAGEAWLRYAGHRASKNLPANREDALYWLTTVMVPEARKARAEARRQSDRDAKFDAEREKQREPAKAPYHAKFIAPSNDEVAPNSVAKDALASINNMFKPQGER